MRFSANPSAILAGECAELGWQVEYVKAVYLDGVGVGGHGTQSICPLQTETHELRVVSASGESRHAVGPHRATGFATFRPADR